MVSIIIATYNRARLLDECLAHLSRQRFAPGDEVIVVDNGSTDRTANVVHGRAPAFPVPLTYVVERRPGKSNAVARAIDFAHGDVLAFTDDDVNVGETWLDDIRATMTDGSVALMGGPVLPRWERRPPRWLPFGNTKEEGQRGFGRLAAPLALLEYGPERVDLGPRTVLGANMAARRDVVNQLGGFAPHLGKRRGTLLSGEDHDLCLRVQAAGFRAMYSPSAPVHHWVPGERMRVRYFVNWFFWSGITNAALEEHAAGSGRAVARVPLFIFRRFIEGLARAAGAAVMGRGAAAVDGVTDAAFAAGYAARRWGYAASSTRRASQTVRATA
jgi:GT2 family glycosyltransferase